MKFHEMMDVMFQCECTITPVQHLSYLRRSKYFTLKLFFSEFLYCLLKCCRGISQIHNPLLRSHRRLVFVGDKNCSNGVKWKLFMVDDFCHECKCSRHMAHLLSNRERPLGQFEIKFIRRDTKKCRLGWLKNFIEP